MGCGCWHAAPVTDGSDDEWGVEEEEEPAAPDGTSLRRDGSGGVGVCVRWLDECEGEGWDERLQRLSQTRRVVRVALRTMNLAVPEIKAELFIY